MAIGVFGIEYGRAYGIDRRSNSTIYALPNSKLAMQIGRVLIVDLIIEFLGWKDSNLRMAESKPAAVPLGDTPTAFSFSMNKIILQRIENIHLKKV